MKREEIQFKKIKKKKKGISLSMKKEERSLMIWTKLNLCH